MAVTVRFRGVMLFHTSKAVGGTMLLEEVLLPDADHVAPPFGSGSGENFLHLDGTRATPHYAILVIQPPHGAPQYVSIRHADVAIGVLPGGNRTRLHGTFSDIADMSTLTGNSPTAPTPLTIDTSATLGARITVGEALTSDVIAANNPFYLGASNPLRIALSLTFAFPLTVRVTMGKLQSTLDILDGSTVWICNSDKPYPSPMQLETELPITAPFMIDHDFKWLYAVLTPVSGDLIAWSRGMLPAPVYVQAGGFAPATVSVSTCLPARI